MVSWPELQAAEPGLFKSAAESYKKLASALEQQHTELNNISGYFDGWTGTGSAAVPNALYHQAQGLAELKNNATIAATALSELAGEITSAKSMLQDALSNARDIPAEVSEDGVVTPKKASGNAAAKKVADAIGDAVRKANVADGTAQSKLAKATDPTNANRAAPASAIPKRGTDPKKVKAWWESMTDAQRQAYIMLHPERIGALDGVNIASRDQANRHVLNNQHSRIKAKLAELKAEGETDKQLSKDFKALEYLKKRLEMAPANGREQAYLIGLDTAGNGKAIVSIGNPDEANNVVTYVPGTFARLSSIQGDINRMESTVADARRLSPLQKTAGIMWLGYEAPQNLGPTGAGDGKFADKATNDLARFQQGLRATHTGVNPSHNTMIGHSYGSTTIGFAAREAAAKGRPIDTNKIIFVGSPGVGVDKAEDLGIGAGNVYGSTAKGDAIYVTHYKFWKKAGMHYGTNPNSEEFGGHRFYSAPASNFNPGKIHTGYWDEKNRWHARRNMARIIIGKPETITGDFD